MAWDAAEMIDDGGVADAICHLPRTGVDFQHLAECSQRMSGYFSGVVSAGIRDDHDPKGLMPARMAAGREDAGNALGDFYGVVARRYDNADRPNFRWWAVYRYCDCDCRT